MNKDPSYPINPLSIDDEIIRLKVVGAKLDDISRNLEHPYGYQVNQLMKEVHSITEGIDKIENLPIKKSSEIIEI